MSRIKGVSPCGRGNVNERKMRHLNEDIACKSAPAASFVTPPRELVLRFGSDK